MADDIFSQGLRNIQQKIREALLQARDGENVETLTNQLSSQINTEWMNCAREYGERMETQRSRDRREHERQLKEMERALNEQHRNNIKLRGIFHLHLINVRTIMNDHEKFRNMGVETLIHQIGHYFTSLDNLLVHHEDVEFANENREFFESLRAQSAIKANDHNNQLTNHLSSNILYHLPIPSICHNHHQIYMEINEIQSILGNLSSKIGFLTPEYWKEEDVLEITSLKQELKEKTTNLVQLIEGSEATHRIMVQQKMKLPVEDGNGRILRIN